MAALVTLTCAAQCGATFERKHPNQKYCSQKCRDAVREARKFSVERGCKSCGGTFTTSNRNQWFCTVQCRNGRKGIINPWRVPRVCANVKCGETFMPHSHSQRYCRKECWYRSYWAARGQRPPRDPRACSLAECRQRSRRIPTTSATAIQSASAGLTRFGATRWWDWLLRVAASFTVAVKLSYPAAPTQNTAPSTGSPRIEPNSMWAGFAFSRMKPAR